MASSPSPAWLLHATHAPLPPKAPGLPLLGNTLALRHDPLQFFVKLYLELGPAFRVKIMGQTFSVLAGLEANRFLQQHGEEFLGSEHLFGGFGEQLGANKFMVAMDGEPHKHQRRVQQRAYSRNALAAHIPKVVEIVRAYAGTLRSPQPLLPSLQRMVAEQMAVITTGIAPGEFYEDLWTVLNVNMKSTVLKMLPRAVLWTPQYRRAKARTLEFGQRVLDWHRANPPSDTRPPDLVDDMVAAKDENGQPYSEGTLRAVAVGPYFAGIDTVASTLSFLMFSILRSPELTALATAEADAIFSRPQVTLEDLRSAKTLINCILETLRMYPVAPFTPRLALKTFEFGGKLVPQGSPVMVANALPHYLPEFFPDPQRFDPSRYEGGRKVAATGAFAPYSVGAHTCLGAGLAEAQMLLTAATLLHAARLELAPRDFHLRIQADPLPNLGRKLTMQAVELRKPAAPVPDGAAHPNAA